MTAKEVKCRNRVVAAIVQTFQLKEAKMRECLKNSNLMRARELEEETKRVCLIIY